MRPDTLGILDPRRRTMSDVKHTPGPWNATCLDVKHGRPIGDDGIRYWCIEPPWTEGDRYRGGICNVHAAEHIDGISVAERDANARLIASAPELLAVAKAALAFIDSHVADPDITEEMVTKYNALRLLEPHDVIAKAEGRA